MRDVVSTEKKPSVLIVDDDIQLCALINDYLTKAGFVVSECYDGSTAIPVILDKQPDILVLDVMLPSDDGLSVCRHIRQGYTGAILMLTAMDDVSDEIVGLEVGADDYVTKPVSPRLLLARIRNLLRRNLSAQNNSHHNASERIQVDDLVIDQLNREVYFAGEHVRCTTAEFELLWLLASNAGKIISREDIYQQIYRYSASPEDRRIDLMVSRLRRKLNDSSSNPLYIKTIRGKGYLMSKGHL